MEFEKLKKIIAEVLGWIKRKLVELDAKIDVIQGKKKLAVEEDRWFSVQEVSDYLPEHPAVQTLYTWKTDRHAGRSHTQG